MRVAGRQRQGHRRRQQPHQQAGFLGDLADRSLGALFVGFDVATGDHDPTQPGVSHQPKLPTVVESGEYESPSGRMFDQGPSRPLVWLADQPTLLQPDPATSTAIRRLEALAPRRRSSSEGAAMIAASWFDGIDGLLADWDARVLKIIVLRVLPRLERPTCHSGCVSAAGCHPQRSGAGFDSLPADGAISARDWPTHPLPKEAKLEGY